MKVCFIGSTGHVGYVLDGCKKEPDIRLCGVSPGSEGENVIPFYEMLMEQGYPVRYFDNYCEMLDEVKPDVAVVACHFGDHARVMIQAIQRGINVFTEKPMATCFEDLIQIQKTYSENPVHLSAMFGIRYCPWFLSAHRAVKDGLIGQIRLINAQKSYKLGIRGENYKNRKSYGGTIPWVGSHAIDWVYWFSGEKFQSVYATHSNHHNKGHRELETSALCHFTLSNEIFASVSIDYYRPDNAPSHDDDRIRVVGTKGIIEVRDRKVLVLDDQSEGIQELEQKYEMSIFQDFLQQMRGQKQCMVSAEDAFCVTEACLKARQSADEKRIIYFR